MTKDTHNKYVMKFVREQRLIETYEGSIEEYWNNIYDLFDESDAMIIQSISGRPLTEAQVKKALLLLVENMSEDGQPLIWRVYDGSLFLAINRKASPFGLASYRQYKSLLPRENLEKIFDEATIKRFEKKIQKTQPLRNQPPKDFDFGGILPRHVIEGKKEVSLRKSVEAIFDEVRQMINLESDYSKWVRDCIIALEPVIHDSPFVRDTDIEELVDTLYDDLTIESNVKASEVETFQRDTKIAEFLEHMERLHQTRKKVFGIMKANKEMIIRAYPFTMQDVVGALKTVQPISDPFLDWLRRSAIKLEEDKRLKQTPIIHELAERQFNMLEDFAEDCFWCGEKEIMSDHMAHCVKRSELLLHGRNMLDP